MSGENHTRKNKEATAAIGSQLQSYVEEKFECKLGAQAYLQKNKSLNRVQFVTAFNAATCADSEKNASDYWKVAAVMENVMLKAYYANRILDGKKGMFSSSNLRSSEIKEAVGENLSLEWYTDSLLNRLSLDLVDELTPQERRFVQKAYFKIGERISQGLRMEREELNINKKSLSQIIDNFEEKYTSRCVDYDLVYDYATLVGYGLAAEDYDIIEKFETEIPKTKRMSYHIQAFNDLGDFCESMDQYSDIKNGIVTMPGFLLKDCSAYTENLYDNRFLQFPRVKKELTGALREYKVAEKMREHSGESKKDILKFWKRVGVNNKELFETYSMMDNNKYFNEITGQKD